MISIGYISLCRADNTSIKSAAIAILNHLISDESKTTFLLGKGIHKRTFQMLDYPITQAARDSAILLNKILSNINIMQEFLECYSLEDLLKKCSYEYSPTATKELLSCALKILQNKEVFGEQGISFLSIMKLIRAINNTIHIDALKSIFQIFNILMDDIDVQILLLNKGILESLFRMLQRTNNSTAILAIITFINQAIKINKATEELIFQKLENIKFIDILLPFIDLHNPTELDQCIWQALSIFSIQPKFAALLRDKDAHFLVIKSLNDSDKVSIKHHYKYDQIQCRRY